MAFRFGTSGASAFASSTANDSIQVGPELEEIQTEVGFVPSAAKIYLLYTDTL